MAIKSTMCSVHVHWFETHKTSNFQRIHVFKNAYDTCCTTLKQNCQRIAQNNKIKNPKNIIMCKDYNAMHSFFIIRSLQTITKLLKIMYLLMKVIFKEEEENSMVLLIS